jgi:hypothetical protein
MGLMEIHGLTRLIGIFINFVLGFDGHLRRVVVDVEQNQEHRRLIPIARCGAKRTKHEKSFLNEQSKRNSTALTASALEVVLEAHFNRVVCHAIVAIERFVEQIHCQHARLLVHRKVILQTRRASEVDVKLNAIVRRCEWNWKTLEIEISIKPNRLTIAIRVAGNDGRDDIAGRRVLVEPSFGLE